MTVTGLAQFVVSVVKRGYGQQEDLHKRLEEERLENLRLKTDLARVNMELTQQRLINSKLLTAVKVLQKKVRELS